MDNRYAPPRAHVHDVATSQTPSNQPDGSRTISRRGRIQIGIASVIIFAYAAYLLRWVVLWRAWVWLIMFAFLVLLGVLLLRRHPLARLLVTGWAAVHVGAWLFSSVAAVVNMRQIQFPARRASDGVGIAARNGAGPLQSCLRACADGRRIRTYLDARWHDRDRYLRGRHLFRTLTSPRDSPDQPAKR
jgi:hypothetical protein